MNQKNGFEKKQSTGNLQEKLAAVLNIYQPYFAGDIANLNAEKIEPLEVLLSEASGVETKIEVFSYDAESKTSKQFFQLLNQLDGLSYGDKKLAMPCWVSLDCGMLPSGFIGFYTNLKKCPQEILKKFSFSHTSPYDPVPVSEFCCIPTAQQGTWIGHTLASVANGKNLGLLSKILGLALFGVRHYQGVTQWDNTSLMTHTKIADLDIVSAPCPAHSEPEKTFVYQHDVPKSTIELLAKFGAHIDAKDPTCYLSLHRMPDFGAAISVKDLKSERIYGAEYAVIYPGMIFNHPDTGKKLSHPVVPLNILSNGCFLGCR